VGEPTHNERCEDCSVPFWRWATMFWRGWWKCGNCGAINVPADDPEATTEPHGDALGEKP
jgi:hypothetical protein